MMVWLEQFSSDFNKPPHYTNLKRLNTFVDEEMGEEYTKDLSKKIKEKLQTFIITPYESEGTLTFFLIWKWLYEWKLMSGWMKRLINK